jgi:hypothetical protein
MFLSHLNFSRMNIMETYIDLFLSADGEKASEIQRRLRELGLKPAVGDHDFMYDWKGVADTAEIIAFVDKVQAHLKGTGVILKFNTVR